MDLIPDTSHSNIDCTYVGYSDNDEQCIISEDEVTDPLSDVSDSSFFTEATQHEQLEEASTCTPNPSSLISNSFTCDFRKSSESTTTDRLVPCSCIEIDTSTCGATVSPLSKKKSITWGHVKVRAFLMMVGDHPATTKGPPLTIAWEPRREIIIPIEDFEKIRGSRRPEYELKLSWYEREKILRNAGTSFEEIRNGTLQARRIQRQRDQTISHLKMKIKLQAMLKSIARSIRKPSRIV